MKNTIITSIVVASLGILSSLAHAGETLRLSKGRQGVQVVAVAKQSTAENASPPTRYKTIALSVGDPIRETYVSALKRGRNRR